MIYIISTGIDITTPGTYSFKWLMRQPSGVESDKGNDSWLYFPDEVRVQAHQWQLRHCYQGIRPGPGW